MQNTKEFIELHEDELQELVDVLVDGDLEGAVCKFVQEVGADVDAEDVAYNLALNVLYNYYDDGGEGGAVMIGFFADVEHEGYDSMNVFVEGGGDLRKVAETSDFVRYALQLTTVTMGLDISILEAYEHDNK